VHRRTPVSRGQANKVGVRYAFKCVPWFNHFERRLSAYIAFLFPAYAGLGAVRRGNLSLLAEDNAQCALDLAEPPRIEGEGDFDCAICRSVDFKPKPPCSEFHQVQLEVPGIRFWFVRLNITNAGILVFEVALKSAGFAQRSRANRSLAPLV
jgi:hypothetical protein